MAAAAQAVFITLVAVLVVVKRRELARAQAAVLGGSVLPGCVVAEALALLVLAAAILFEASR